MRRGLSKEYALHFESYRQWSPVTFEESNKICILSTAHIWELETINLLTSILLAQWAKVPSLIKEL